MQKQLIEAIKAGPEPLDDELFLAIFEIADQIEQQKFIEAARAKCREQKKLTEFNNMLRVWQSKNAQNIRQQGSNKTKFTDAPLVLNCGQWEASDAGIYKNELSSRGTPHRAQACPHPILPVERLVNIDTGMEMLKLEFYKDKHWQHITVDCATCYNKQSIIKLANRGIMVTSETAKYLVQYLHDLVSFNMECTTDEKAIPMYRSISRLGWVENDFAPYTESIKYDGDIDFENVYKHVNATGDRSTWYTLVNNVRKNNIARLLIATSLASPLIERVGALPFVFHLWGTTSFGKTVSLMVAMSVWGNPAGGALTRTMNMTSAAMAKTAAFLRNIPFAADELQQIKDRWSDFDKLIMYLTEGMDKGRATVHGGIEQMQEWKCCFIFTGEEPITKDNSGGGTKNRVIEVEVTKPIYESGYLVANTIRENYGWAGKEFIEYVKQISVEELRVRYKLIFDEIMQKCDTTDKQALSMALILLADELSCESIFGKDSPLSVDDIKQYLSSAKKIDASERAYDITSGWITSSQNEFAIEEADGKCIMPSGKVHGKILNNKEFAEVLKNDLQRFLQENGFSYDAIIGKWREKGYIEVFRNGKGKKPISTHNVSIGAIKKASCVRLRLSLENARKADEWTDEVEQSNLF